MAEGLTAAEAAVLLAVHRGLDTVDKLARYLRASREDVEAIVARLEARGLLRREKRGLILKRTVLRLTEKGLEALPEAERLLSSAAEAARRMLLEPQPGAVQPRYQAAPAAATAGFDPLELAMILPLLGWLGFLPLSAMEAAMLGAMMGSRVEEGGEEAWAEEESGEWGEEGEDVGYEDSGVEDYEFDVDLDAEGFTG